MIIIKRKKKKRSRSRTNNMSDQVASCLQRAAPGEPTSRAKILASELIHLSVELHHPPFPPLISFTFPSCLFTRTSVDRLSCTDSFTRFVRRPEKYFGTPGALCFISAHILLKSRFLTVAMETQLHRDPSLGDTLLK